MVIFSWRMFSWHFPQVFTAPPSEKFATDYKDFYVFGGEYDKPNPNDRLDIALMDLPNKVFEYLNGHQTSMSRNEIRMCTHLIVLILKSTMDQKSREKYIEMETIWISERTADPHVHEIHISNIKNAISFPSLRNTPLKPSIKALVDSVSSSINK